MNLVSLRTFSRLTIPSAKKSRISPTNLNLVINEVVKDLNIRLKLLKQDDKFNVVADQYKYDLSDSSETVSRFAKIDNLGLYWNSGSATSPDWTRIVPKTLRWLDKNVSQWRDAESGDPMYYAKKGKYLYTYPTPDTALDNGFWLYYIENPTSMSKNSDFPFGATTEISEYAFLSKTIIKGVESWLLSSIGKEQLAQTAFQTYIGMVEDNRKTLQYNLDITSDKEVRLRISRVC